MNKELDILAVGELNVDLIFNDISGSIEIGTERVASEYALCLGSSTAIFSSNAASLGSKVGFLGKVGNDNYGQFIKWELEKNAVDTAFVITDDTVGTGVTVVMSFDEERSMVTYLGAMSKFSMKDVSTVHFQSAKHLHYSSYFLQSGLKKDVAELFEKAKFYGMTTSLDLQYDPKDEWEFDEENILPNVDVFMPNQFEVLKVLGADNVNEALDYLRKYKNTAVIKKGSEGATMLKPQGEIVSLKGVVNSHVVDAIGAGDSFNSGFIHMYVKNHPLEKCLEFGNLTGMVNTKNAGGTAAFTSHTEIIKDWELANN